MENQDKKVMRFDESKVDDRYFYLNQLDFPLLSDMRQATLMVVDSAASWSRTRHSVIIRALGRFYHKRYFYRFFDFQPTYDESDDTRPITIEIEAVSDTIIRVRMTQGTALPDKASPMLMDLSRFQASKFDVNEENGKLTITTRSLKINVNKAPWNLEIEDLEGKKLYTQYTSCRGQDRPVMKYEQPPFGFLFDPVNEKSYACDQAVIKYQESIYGLGEQFLETRRNGQRISLWNTNALGCNSERSYKNIPFFMSTEGYGIFWHTSHASRADMGASFTKAYGFMTEDKALDFFFIHGPEFSQILSQYTDLTGKAPMPPDWSFGFWISKISYRSEEEVLALARKFRAENIPCDVIHIDTAWFEHDWVCDYQFSKSRFPDPHEMIEKLKEMRFRITLWQLPYLENGIDNENPVFVEGKQKGYFATHKSGVEDYPNRLVDYSNPEAVRWTQDKLLRPLLETGVAAFKVDFGESVPPHYHYAGAASSAMHNLYPLLYNKAVFEATKAVHGEDQGLIWARSAWTGSQRYPVHWAGDPDVDFGGLASTIRAGLSMGMSGFPFWSHDVGGFNAPAIPEVYARWMQVGCFTSHIRAHGHVTREPWDFGPEVQAISKKYLQLRYRLMPYILSQAKKCSENSIPMFRALVLEYTEDRNVRHIDDQYLFGDSFLIAPILDASNERQVYLPKGRWTDYWNKELINGGQWIHIRAPLDTLPIYVRENAVIPMAPVMQYVNEKAIEPLTLDVYPSSPGKQDYSWEIGSQKVSCSLSVTDERIEIQLNGSQTEICFVVHHVSQDHTAIWEEAAVPGRRSNNTWSFSTPLNNNGTLRIRSGKKPDPAKDPKKEA